MLETARIDKGVLVVVVPLDHDGAVRVNLPDGASQPRLTTHLYGVAFSEWNWLVVVHVPLTQSFLSSLPLEMQPGTVFCFEVPE